MFRPKTSLTCTKHDCRPDRVKYRTRDTLYDASILCKGINQTKKSMIQLHEKYIQEQMEAQHNLLIELNRKLVHDDKILKEIESGGNSELEYDNMHWPNAVLSTHHGDIVVCDTLNHRILVFNKALIHKYTLGSKGNLNGQFDEPFDIALSSIEELIVADKNNSRIQIYEERYILQQSKTRINAFLRNTVSGETMSTVTTLARSSSLQYKFKLSIKLDSKPLKVCTSLITMVYAVSTTNGSIYVFNGANRIIALTKMTEQFDNIDMRNICLSSNANQLLQLKNVDGRTILRHYQYYENKLEKLKDESTNKVYEIEKIYTMQLVRQIEVHKFYYPGVCLDRAIGIMLTPDSENFVVYDPQNLCILMFDFEGNLAKILFRAYDRLDHVLAFNFSPEGHFLTCEYELRNLSTEKTNKLTRVVTTVFSKKHIFKVKIYRYLDCECHKRQRGMVSKKRAVTSMSLRRTTSTFSNYN